MNPIVTFLSGAALLILFVYYLGTVAKDRKRVVGTALSLLVAIFFIVTFSKMGMKLGIDLQGGSTFLVQLKPGTDEKGVERKVSKDSVDQAVSILEKRLNPDGKADMLIQPTGEDRIEIQMPGVKTEDIVDVRTKIQQVAKLEFRLVHPQSGSLESKLGYVCLLYTSPSPRD